MMGPYVNPATLDYDLINGNIENRNALYTLSSMRLNCPRGAWPYNKNFGNPLKSEIINLATTTRGYLKQQVEIALQDLVTLGYASNLVVWVESIDYSSRTATFKIIIVDKDKTQLSFVWSLET